MSLEHTNIVELKNLSYSLETKAILQNIDLVVPKAKITAIMGPSGCGKTTLLRLMTGQIKPNHGKVYFNTRDLNCLSRKDLALERKKMGVLFQNAALFSELSVYENVAFPLQEHTNLTPTMIRDLVYMKLEAVGLRGAATLMPAQLSGGMARRVALARAIALDPSLILYDEPFVGQDPISMAVIIKLISLLNKSLGITSVIISHDIQETIALADHLYLIANGQIVGSGDPAELLNSDNPWIAQFMQGRADGPVSFHYPTNEDYLTSILKEA